MKKTFIIILFLSFNSYAQVELFKDLKSKKEGPQYVGTKTCAMCHSSERMGDQYSIWKNSAHAHAMETLKSKKAIDLGKKYGVKVPSKSNRCIQCHLTAYDAKKEMLGKLYVREDSLGCESCHGPGELYSNFATMMNRQRAINKGLIKPQKSDCLKCHDSRRRPGATSEKENILKLFQKIKHYRKGSTPSKEWKLN